VRRRDKEAFVLDGVHLRDLDVGIAWPTFDDAFKDACRFIDRMIRAGALRQTENLNCDWFARIFDPFEQLS
jgi:hypothetical protein